jgi:hypothetical protein
MAYVINFYYTDGVTRGPELTSCDGSDATILSARTCTVPSATFTMTPFNLEWGSSIIAEVIAKNSIGSSISSDSGNGALILTKPGAPINLVNDILITDGDQIGLSWSEGLEDGGTPVIDHRILYAAGADTFATLDSNIVGASYTAINLAAGTSYKFKVEARSSFGYSLASAEVVVLAAEVPSKPDAPTTIFNGDTVQIDWVAPNAGGSDITGYRIFILESDGVTYSLELDDCDGTSTQAIVDNQQCTVYVATLRD